MTNTLETIGNNPEAEIIKKEIEATLATDPELAKTITTLRGKEGERDVFLNKAVEKLTPAEKEEYTKLIKMPEDSRNFDLGIKEKIKDFEINAIRKGLTGPEMKAFVTVSADIEKLTSEKTAIIKKISDEVISRIETQKNEAYYAEGIQTGTNDHFIVPKTKSRTGTM